MYVRMVKIKHKVAAANRCRFIHQGGHCAAGLVPLRTRSIRLLQQPLVRGRVLASAAVRHLQVTLQGAHLRLLLLDVCLCYLLRLPLLFSLLQPSMFSTAAIA